MAQEEVVEKVESFEALPRQDASLFNEKKSPMAHPLAGMRDMEVALKLLSSCGANLVTLCPVCQHRRGSKKCPADTSATISRLGPCSGYDFNEAVTEGDFVDLLRIRRSHPCFP